MRLFTYRRAGAVVVDRDRVLLVSMQPPGEQRWWLFPGGQIEEGETPADAAVRELFEETGLRATSCREFLRLGVHGGEHVYFAMTCEDFTIGEVTGPETVYAADADFRAEWVPIASLASMPVFPRCVAERVAEDLETDADWVQDDRGSWDGIPGASPPPHLRFTVRAVLRHDRGVAAIERRFQGETWFTLPGGSRHPGETAEQAVVREVQEELGLRVQPGATLAVVEYRRRGSTALQHYLACRTVGGDFGSGTGDEYTRERQSARGRYRPVWLDPGQLPEAMRPSWLAVKLPTWLIEPPHRPERFCEVHDD